MWATRVVLHHLVRVFLGELLHRHRRPPIRIALAQHRVHRRAQDHGETGLQGALLVGGRFFGIVGYVVTLALQLRDGILQLRDRGADVGQLDDVGVRGPGQFAQAAQLVGDLLILTQIVGKVGDNAPGEGDVRGLDLDARALEKGLYYRE